MGTCSTKVEVIPTSTKTVVDTAPIDKSPKRWCFLPCLDRKPNVTEAGHSEGKVGKKEKKEETEKAKPEIKTQRLWFTCCVSLREVECPICLKAYVSFDKLSTLNCGHEFHHQCVYAWLDNSPSCPMCRVIINK